MIKQVFTPRLSFLMRGANQPYIRRPLVTDIKPAHLPQIAMGDTDWHEYGASMAPRANPVWNDLWIVGATGGANKVIPQGIDYSRTPCCMAMAGTAEGVMPLLIGLVAIPAAIFAIAALGSTMPVRRRRNPSKYPWRILAQYKDRRAKEVDTTNSKSEAEYLVSEYSIAYGKDWKVWKTQKFVDPRE